VNSRDFEEFLSELNAADVRYLIIGGYALAVHARPRATQDLDILFERTEENANRLLQALSRFFGGMSIDQSAMDLVRTDTILQIGHPPLRIDLFTDIPGIGDFQEAWSSGQVGVFGEVATRYIGREDLIRAKTASGRPQDLADLEALRTLRPGP
jgi:hypothetical protein